MRSVGPRLRASPVRNLSAATARHLTPNLEPESRRPRRAARHGVRHAASVARCAVCGAAWCAACGVRVRRCAECAACGEARRAACGVVRREACGAARRGACSETQPAACGAVRHGVSVWRRGGRVRAWFLACLYVIKRVWLKLRPDLKLLSCWRATMPYLSSAKACAITMGPVTCPHVSTFTGFDHDSALRALLLAYRLELRHARLRASRENM